MYLVDFSENLPIFMAAWFFIFYRLSLMMFLLFLLSNLSDVSLLRVR